MQFDLMHFESHLIIKNQLKHIEIHTGIEL